MRLFFTPRVTCGVAILAFCSELAGLERAEYPTEPPTLQPSYQQQGLPARLLSRRFTTLAAELDAQIERVTVREGGRVSAGDLLATLDCSQPGAALLHAQAEMDAAQRRHMADQRLFELNSVGRLELDLAAAALGKAAAEVQVRQIVVSKCSVQAPFAGRITGVKVRERQYVQPGEALFDIVDDHELDVAFRVPSAWRSRLHVGSRLQVEIDRTGKTYPAELRAIAARVDPLSRSIKVTAALDGSFPELTAGMEGRVSIQTP